MVEALQGIASVTASSIEPEKKPKELDNSNNFINTLLAGILSGKGVSKQAEKANLGIKDNGKSPFLETVQVKSGKADLSNAFKIDNEKAEINKKLKNNSKNTLQNLLSQNANNKTKSSDAPEAKEQSNAKLKIDTSKEESKNLAKQSDSVATEKKPSVNTKEESKIDVDKLIKDSVNNASAVPSQNKANEIKNDNASKRNPENEKSVEITSISQEKQKDGKEISVVDMRVKAKKESAKSKDSSTKTEKQLSEPKLNHETSSEQNFNLGIENKENDLSGTKISFTEKFESKQSPLPTSLAQNLSSRLTEGAQEIVKAAQVVLRDGNSGIIRLRLEPESLGGVKIELKLAEKQITGKIIVESDIAGEAFKSSVDALKDAFAESGFETTRLEIEVHNGAAGENSGSENNFDNETEKPYWTNSLKKLDKAVPLIDNSSYDGLINVLV